MLICPAFCFRSMTEKNKEDKALDSVTDYVEEQELDTSEAQKVRNTFCDPSS